MQSARTKIQRTRLSMAMPMKDSPSTLQRQRSPVSVKAIGRNILNFEHKSVYTLVISACDAMSAGGSVLGSDAFQWSERERLKVATGSTNRSAPK